MNVYIRELSSELSRRGFEIDVFTRWKVPSASEIVNYDGVRVIHLEAGPKGPCDKNLLPQYLPEFLSELTSFTGDNHYSILHSHYWLSGWVAGKLQRAWGIPLIHMFHTLGRLRQGKWCRGEVEEETISLANEIIASNPAEKDHLIEHYNADPDKIEVIPCGVDLRLFKPVDKIKGRRSSGLVKRRYLLFVGRIDPLKRLDTLIKAMAVLAPSYPELRCLVIGGEHGNQYLNELRTMVRKFGLEGFVHFLGAKPQPLLPYFYSLAEACVLPSDYESFGLVGLESMACGTPLIASRVGGLSFLVQDGVNGLLFTPGEERELADRMDLLLRDSKLRDYLGSQALERAKGFSWEIVADSISSLYERYVG